MKIKSSIMVHALLNYFCPKEENSMLRFFSPQDAQQLSALNISDTSLQGVFFSPIEQIQMIHYSWLAPLIASEPPIMQNLYKNFLYNKELAQEGSSLEKYLNLLAYKLLVMFTPTALLPPQYLPRSELHGLVYFSKEKIIEVINLLGICDLAAEIRHIVDRRIIEKAYQSLSPLQQEYLRQRFNMRLQATPARLHLEKWSQESSELKKILHSRGILRFAAALHGEDEYLVWYIIHRLDNKRGQFIKEHISSSAESLPSQQNKILLHILNFLRQKESSS